MSTQSFTHCAMRCTPEQWEQQLKPILELIEGVQIERIWHINLYPYIVNNYHGEIKVFSNIASSSTVFFNRTVLETFDLCEFLDLSGINVVIQGNEVNADKIKQWWEDRGYDMEEYYCSYEDKYYGIVNGSFKWEYANDLPKGTHIINPFVNKDKQESKTRTYPRYMYASDEPMHTNNEGELIYAVGVIGEKIWFVRGESEYNEVVNGHSRKVCTYKYTRELDEPLPKAQYTIEQLIEKAGLNKDEIEVVER